MILGTRIRDLKLWKRKSLRLILMVEAVLLLAGTINLFGKNAVYEYGVGSVWTETGNYSEESGGVFIENGKQGSTIEFNEIKLPRGTYRLQLRYNTTVNYVHTLTVNSGNVGSDRLQCNGGDLFAGLSKTDFEMWAHKNVSDMKVCVEYGGEGRLEVYGLTIRQTNAMARTDLFCLICLMIAADGIYLYVHYDRTYRIEVKKKKVAFLLGIITILAALPLQLEYLPGSGDLFYHLMRVEGIRDGILSGTFPIRISPEWQQGYGYASPVFYGETLVYPAALLRLLGFSVTTSYQIFMFMITFATVMVAYYAFRRIFDEAYIGVFCSMLYALSIYRIYKTYICGSWGECFGIMILPLLVYGFWRVFTEDIHSEGYLRSWVPLTVGFTLLLQSHLLSCEMVGFFTVILCIVLWRRVFRWQTFLVLAKTVVYTILLSSWYLIPFLDYMITGDFVIHHVMTRTIQYRGLYPAHLLFTWFRAGATVFFDQQGMYDSAPMGVGMAPVVTLVVFACLLFNRKLEEMKKEKQFGFLLGIFALLSMWMSLSCFPWDRIQNLDKIIATLVSSIQFPNRFLTIANVSLTAVAGVVAKYVFREKNRWVCMGYFGGITLVLAVSSVYLLEDVMHKLEPIKIYNSQGMGTGYIAGAEYLPYGVDPAQFVYHDPICTGTMEAWGYEKRSLGAEVYVSNEGKQTESVSFALLYYKGYCAKSVSEGKELACYAGENGEVTVDIPADFEGMITVGFESPWYWRAGEIITLAAVLIMLGNAFLRAGKIKRAGTRRGKVQQ